MELVPEHRTVTQDFRPVVENLEYTRITFTVPKNIICFADWYDELEHREVPTDERRLLGLMLRIARHNGYRVKKLLLQEIFRGMSEYGLFEDEDAEDLRQFVEDGIREHHVHGPFSVESYKEYLASKVEDEEEDPAEAA